MAIEKATWHPDMPEEYKNQIVTGDCRELATRIPDESIDIVFTSPPYNVGLNYGFWDDNIEWPQYWEFAKDWLSDAHRVTKSGGRLYLILGDELIWRYKSMSEEIGWKFHQLLAWCKPNIAGGGRITKDWSTLAEWGLLFHKDKRTPMQSGPFNTFNWIIAVSTQSNFGGHKKKLHIAQMALEVPLSWIARTPGAIVLDQFAGSGTTCVASKMLGRDYIAFEIDPDTAELARERVRNTQPPLFVMEPEPAQLDLLQEKS